MQEDTLQQSQQEKVAGHQQELPALAGKKASMFSHAEPLQST